MSRSRGAGYRHTLLLRSDGRAVACGQDGHGQCRLPRLEPGVTYCQVAAGGSHSVLLRSDGRAVAVGLNANGQCDIPRLPPGTKYLDVAAGECHTLLLRSDGRAVACGWNAYGQCDVPEVEGEVGYSSCSSLAQPAGRDLLVQLAVEGPAACPTVVCRSLSGNVIAAWAVKAAELASSVLARVSQEVAGRNATLRVVLPDGRLLSPAIKFSQLVAATSTQVRTSH